MAKAKLRTFRKKEGEGYEFQRQFSDFHWPEDGQGPASGGDYLELLAGLGEGELEEKREVVENMIDLLIEDNIIIQEGTLYRLTSNGKEFFTY